MKYDERIHSKQFRVVARHLADPQSRIKAVLHANSVSNLAALAERVEVLAANPGSVVDLLRALEPLMREKTLLISLPEKTASPFAEFAIPASAIRPSAWSKVLYLPPFYLAHTPGLFESRPCRENIQQEGLAAPLPHRPLRMKM